MSQKGFGIVFEYKDANETWTAVGAVEDATPPSITKDTYETTHHQTPNGHKTFSGGLVDFGEASLTIQYDPSDAAHTEMRTRAATACDEPQEYRFTLADAATTVDTFRAIVTGFEVSTPVDNKITATITFKASGTVTAAPASASKKSVASAPAKT